MPFQSRIPSNVVAGQCNEVGLQAVSDHDATSNVVPGSERTHVDVGELSDTKTIEAFWQTRKAEALPHDFHILATVKEPISRSHERRGDDQHRALPQEAAAAGRSWS